MHLTSIRIDSQRFPDRSSYPFNLALLQNTPELSLTTPVTFFAGENGSGKSTLLRALARKCSINIWGGNDRQRVAAGRYEDSLHHMLEVTWRNGTVPGSFFSSQVFQNFARMLDEWAVTDPGLLQYFGGQSLMNLSHGQSLMAFFRSRYRIRGSICWTSLKPPSLPPASLICCACSSRPAKRAGPSLLSRPTPPSCWPARAPKFSISTGSISLPSATRTPPITASTATFCWTGSGFWPAAMMRPLPERRGEDHNGCEPASIRC
jgi:hypothetical protein